MEADLGAFPRLLRLRPLLLECGEVGLGPVQLLPELHHPPLLRGDSPKEVDAVVIDIKGDGSTGGCRGRTSGGLRDRGHGSGGGDTGVGG